MKLLQAKESKMPIQHLNAQVEKYLLLCHRSNNHYIYLATFIQINELQSIREKH